MIITKCPLRLSLVGGSTDLKEFIDWHGVGSVISFPCTMYVYITLHKNNPGTVDADKFVINYTRREEVDKIEDIHNDVAREVLLWFDKKGPQSLPKLTISFKSDVNSQGSGLAASSAYIIALIKALCMFRHVKMSEIEICKLAHSIELKFNTITGFQDTYGCGMPGLKRMTFYRDGGFPHFQYFDSDVLKQYDMWLVHTGVSRNSTKILKSIDVKKCILLLRNVTALTAALARNDSEGFIKEVRKAWENKQATSPHIMTGELKRIEQVIAKDLNPETEGYKLCGAGGGGYFLVFTRIERIYVIGPEPAFKSLNCVQVKLDEEGITGVRF